MKQLLILSGKGGTGKTTVASALIHLSNAKAYADCDVDAPNLHLITQQSVMAKEKDYFGMPKRRIQNEKCIQCGLCAEKCRFDAIKLNHLNQYEIDPFSCEGCSVCEVLCPEKAIQPLDAPAGRLYLFESDSVFSTAKLNMGSGTSGKLITEVKQQLKDSNVPFPFAIIDGSPGIGCPVIASLSNVTVALIVIEPSLSGISDMERIIKTAQQFRVKTAICVNKYNTNLDATEKIVKFCQLNHIPFLVKYHMTGVWWRQSTKEKALRKSTVQQGMQ